MADDTTKCERCGHQRSSHLTRKYGWGACWAMRIVSGSYNTERACDCPEFVTDPADTVSIPPKIIQIVTEAPTGKVAEFSEFPYLLGLRDDGEVVIWEWIARKWILLKEAVF